MSTAGCGRRPGIRPKSAFRGGFRDYCSRPHHGRTRLPGLRAEVAAWFGREGLASQDQSPMPRCGGEGWSTGCRLCVAAYGIALRISDLVSPRALGSVTDELNYAPTVLGTDGPGSTRWGSGGAPSSDCCTAGTLPPRSSWGGPSRRWSPSAGCARSRSCSMGYRPESLRAGAATRRSCRRPASLESAHVSGAVWVRTLP